MHRIDSTYAEADKFGAGKDGFTEGTPGTVPATETTDDWFDGVQEEIISPIEAMGITLVKNTRDQLLDALKQIQGSIVAANWVQRTSGKNVDMSDVAFYDGLFVAVGNSDGVDATILTSPDGITWTEVAPTVAVNTALYGVAHNGSNLWCAVGDTDAGDAYILTSPDGVVWTRRGAGTLDNIPLTAVAHDQSGLWVAVGGNDGVDAYIVTSSDGVTWTERAPTVPKLFDLLDVAYGNGLWVAVGDPDGVDAYIVTSSDGVTWVERSNPKNFVLNSVDYGNGVWVAVGNADGTDAYLLRSTDGTTWSAEISNPTNTTLYGVAFGDDGIWVACGHAVGPDAYLLTSSDNGATWVERKSLVDEHFNGVCFGHDSWVIVGDTDGVDAEILQSLFSGFVY